MRKLILITFMLCFLSTQVLGSVVYENEHKQQGDIHGLIHELGQPHSHDHDDESNFKLSYSVEAFEHIAPDTDCCVFGLIDASPRQTSDKNLSGTVIWYASNWSSPHLQHIKPPPRY